MDFISTFTAIGIIPILTIQAQARPQPANDSKYERENSKYDTGWIIYFEYT